MTTRQGKAPMCAYPAGCTDEVGFGLVRYCLHHSKIMGRLHRAFTPRESFLFRCQQPGCDHEEVLPAHSSARRYCAACIRKRDYARKRDKYGASGKPPKKPASGKPKWCAVCAGLPDRRPLTGCQCGGVHMVRTGNGPNDWAIPGENTR